MNIVPMWISGFSGWFSGCTFSTYLNTTNKCLILVLTAGVSREHPKRHRGHRHPKRRPAVGEQPGPPDWPSRGSGGRVHPYSPLRPGGPPGMFGRSLAQRSETVRRAVPGAPGHGDAQGAPRGQREDGEELPRGAPGAGGAAGARGARAQLIAQNKQILSRH
ncbi:hypothetical protein FOCC_FOCC017462, partial [Frankliniella occidentalis]